MTVSTARVRVLGGLVVEDVGEQELASRKGRLLLKILATARGRPVSADRLAEILWGGSQPSRPAEQVGVLVSRLRSVLGADRLPRTDAGYAFIADWLDLDELAARVAEATDALRGGRLGVARAAAEAASALARGPVLPEEEGEWVETERAEAALLVASARRIAAEAADLGGDYAAAGALAEQALIHDPFDEVSLRVLMRAHVAGGRPASALAAYGALRERLVEEFGLSPTPETEALHDEIVLADPGPPPAPSRSNAPTLHGRAAELHRLDAALDRVVAGGESTTIVITGEPGIGKTALVEQWVPSAMAKALLLIGHGHPLGRDLPLQPIVDALAEHLAALGSQAQRDVAIGPDAAIVGGLLNVAVVGAETRADIDMQRATVVADAELGRARLFASLLAVVGRLAGGRPVVFAVDDLHLAGGSSLAWLAFAARRQPRMLIVATSRVAVGAALSDATVIPLGPLDLAATESIVGGERSVELHALSGGHPLLLRALIAAGDGALPATVGEAVARRLDGLGEAAATVRAAAILGSEIDLDLLAEVLRAPAVALLDHLEAAAGRGLLAERGSGFCFRHELEREALAESAGSTRRALVHREAARALTTRPVTDPLRVATHARLGGELGLAVDWYVKAAEIAAARFDLEAAEVHLNAALALEPSAAALMARARVRMATFRLEEAAVDAEAAIAAGGGSDALEVAGWVAYYRRDYALAQACADEGTDRATSGAVRVSCLALAGRVRHGAGDLPGAVVRLEEGVATDAPAEVRAVAGVWLAHARLHQGRPADAVAILQRALVDPDRLAHPFAGLHGRMARAMALGYGGRIPEALVACNDFDAAITRAGAAGGRFLGPAANTRAWILRWCGLSGEADESNVAGIANTDPTGARAEAYYAGLLDLADGRLLAADIAGAGAVLERLAPIGDWTGTMGWHQRHRWRIVRARVALAGGDRDEAAGLADEVASDAAVLGARRYELFATAWSALAGGQAGSEPSKLDAVITGLAECARLDGWPLIAELARTFDVAAWRTEAERLAAAVVRGAPNDRAARALVERVFA